MSGITLLARDASDIPTPSAGKSTVFLDVDTGRVRVKDDSGAVADFTGTVLETVTPPNPVGTAAPGTGTTGSAWDHVHAHGTQLGGALHANAIAAGAAGFLSGTDKTKLDTLTTGAAVSTVTASAPVVSSGGTTPDISMAAASGTVPGYVTTSAQSIAGAKTFTGAISASNLSGTNTGDVTIGTANGLSVASQAVSLAAATTSTPGALSASDKTKLDSVTSNAAVASVSGTSPIASSGGTTPAISLNTNGVADTHLRQGAALTVIGRAANTTGNVADIAATAASGQVLKESGSTLVFGKIVAANITAATITDTEIAAANKDGSAGTASLRTLGTGAAQAAAGNDSRLSDSRAPNGSAGGSLTGSYPNPTIAALAVTDAEVAAANKDGTSGTASLRTLGTGAAQACAGNDSRLTNSRAPNGTAGGSLAGSYPNPTIAALAITDAEVATANKDGSSGTASLRTLGTGAAQSCAGNDSRLSDSRAPNGSAGGSLTGTYPNPTVAALAITDAMVATANKDGVAGTASLRTLGTGAAQACGGTDSRLSDSRAPNGSASGDLGGTYPSPTVTAIHETSGPNKITAGSITANTMICRDNSSGLVSSYYVTEPTYGADFFDDFIAQTVTGGLSWTQGTAGASATSAQEQTTPGVSNPGVISITPGTSTTGRLSLALQSEGVVLGGGITLIEIMVQVPTLSVVGDEFVVRVGLNDTQGGTNSDATDGVYFVYDRLNSGANWQARTASGSSRTTTDTGVAIVAGTWYKLRAIVNSAGTSVAFYVNSLTSVACTITTNIPLTTHRTGPLIRMDKTAGTTAINVYVDYFWLNKAFTTGR